MKTRKESDIRGMTIVELMISLGIFTLVATTATSIFVQIIKTSRLVTARSTAIDNLSLVVEQIAREIRTGKEFDNVSPNPLVTAKELKFRNYLGKVVIYKFNNATGRLEKDGIPITPEGLKIEGNFILTNFLSLGNSKETTPRALVSVVAKDAKGIVLARAQTTVGARLIYYKR